MCKYIYNWDRGRIDILLEKQLSKIDKGLFFSPNMCEKTVRLLEILLHPTPHLGVNPQLIINVQLF